MHLLVVIIWELLQMCHHRRYPWLVVLSLLKRIWGQCRGVITHFTSRDIWNRYPIPDPSQYIFLKHNTRSSLSKPFPLSLKTQFLSAAVKYNTTEQIPQRPHVFLLLDTNKKTKTGRLVLSPQRTWLNQCKSYFQPLDMIAFFCYSQHSSLHLFSATFTFQEKEIKRGLNSILLN